MLHRDLRQVAALFAETLQNFGTLFRGEIALVKAELKENASRAGVGLIMLAVAAILALTATQILATALVAWIAASGLSAGLAALIVGVALFLGAAGLLAAGKARLTSKALFPTRSIRNLKRDVESMKEATNVRS
ncbi:phage holin family protein [Phaeobacter sp. HF9A]|uniref:phage holin family protein n=1 Tax=Phaeobacter sp. HF9A TaxID=2721561 RepID=UPI0014319707|nr:phage holin family protein [Phaeobacter sp. HF9A]NIZ12087.1 phage holin family protein [Phaeobacter sp. HF9A]